METVKSRRAVAVCAARCAAVEATSRLALVALPVGWTQAVALVAHATVATADCWRLRHRRAVASGDAL